MRVVAMAVVVLAVVVLAVVIVLGVITWVLTPSAPGPAVWLTPSSSPSI